MKSYTIEISKIHCVSPTKWEWGKDEIFYAVVAIEGKLEGKFSDDNAFSDNDLALVDNIKAKVVKGFVSDAKKEVRKGSIWKPSDGNIHIKIDDTCNILSLLVILYEEDSGEKRVQLSNAFNNNNFLFEINEKPDFKAILEKLKQSAKETAAVAAATSNKYAIAFAIAKAVFKVSHKLIKEIRKDDLIDCQVCCCDLNNTETLSLPREYIFKGDGAEYNIGIIVSESK
jgi:hypothetical protein